MAKKKIIKEEKPSISNFSSRTNPAVQFGRKASEGKSGLQIFPRLKTRLCSGKGTPLVGRVRRASVASSRRTPGSSCQGHRDRWSLVCPGHRPHFLLPSEEDPGREQAATAGASADRARAQPWALSRYLCLLHSRTPCSVFCNLLLAPLTAPS